MQYNKPRDKVTVVVNMRGIDYLHETKHPGVMLNSGVNTSVEVAR